MPGSSQERVNERSASALRRLHNYMRASMGNSRLSSIALLHIHYDMDVDLDEVVTRYAHLHPRKLELDYYPPLNSVKTLCHCILINCVCI